MKNVFNGAKGAIRESMENLPVNIFGSGGGGASKKISGGNYTPPGAGAGGGSLFGTN